MNWLLMIVGPLLIAYIFVIVECVAMVQMSGAWRILSVLPAVAVPASIAVALCTQEHPVDIYRSAVIAFAGGLAGIILLWVAYIRFGRGARLA